jgi:predicted metalloprotease
VQTFIGVSAKVQKAKRRMSKANSNALQVKMELQADCFAGVCAHHADRARSILEAIDIDEALRAAAAIGDDRIQRQSQGYVSPESFTHGSSAQRQRWFKQRLQEGKVAKCDTFSTKNL